MGADGECSRGCSGSASEEDPYSSIPGGRLVDNTSGASSSEPEPESECEASSGAHGTHGRRSVIVATTGDGCV